MLKSQPSIFSGLGNEGRTIEAYFESFNRGEFTQTSQLFCGEGCLYPPFEAPIHGPDAIAQYLYQEAEGMKADPLSATIESTEHRCKVTVKGKVTALVFRVNVVWDFALNSQGQILAVKINLLASLEELFKMRVER